MSSGKEINYPDDRKYSATHEWVKLNDLGDTAIVGISDYAQDALGDVVFVELPVVGNKFQSGLTFGVIESVKAASDVFMPVGGEINSVNHKLNDSPELVNRDPFGEGWLIKVLPFKKEDYEGLMDAAAYKSKIESGEIH